MKWEIKCGTNSAIGAPKMSNSYSNYRDNHLKISKDSLPFINNNKFEETKVKKVKRRTRKKYLIKFQRVISN